MWYSYISIDIDRYFTKYLDIDRYRYTRHCSRTEWCEDPVQRLPIPLPAINRLQKSVYFCLKCRFSLTVNTNLPINQKRLTVADTKAMLITLIRPMVGPLQRARTAMVDDYTDWPTCSRQHSSAWVEIYYRSTGRSDWSLACRLIAFPAHSSRANSMPPPRTPTMGDCRPRLPAVCCRAK